MNVLRLLVVAAAVCASGTTSAIAGAIYTYTNNLDDCNPEQIEINKQWSGCASGSVKITVDTNTDIITGSILGISFPSSTFSGGLNTLTLPYVNGRWTGGWLLDASAGEAFEPAVQFASSAPWPVDVDVVVPVYDYAVDNPVLLYSIAYALHPGSWSIGDAIEGKELGASGGGVVSGGGYGSYPRNPGGCDQIPVSDANDCGCGSHPGQITRGEPISVGSGNMFEKVVDYATVGQNTVVSQFEFSASAASRALVL